MFGEEFTQTFYQRYAGVFSNQKSDVGQGASFHQLEPPWGIEEPQRATREEDS